MFILATILGLIFIIMFVFGVVRKRKQLPPIFFRVKHKKIADDK